MIKKTFFLILFSLFLCNTTIWASVLYKPSFTNNEPPNYWNLEEYAPQYSGYVGVTFTCTNGVATMTVTTITGSTNTGAWTYVNGANWHDYYVQFKLSAIQDDVSSMFCISIADPGGFVASDPQGLALRISRNGSVWRVSKTNTDGPTFTTIATPVIGDVWGVTVTGISSNVSLAFSINGTPTYLGNATPGINSGVGKLTLGVIRDVGSGTSSWSINSLVVMSNVITPTPTPVLKKQSWRGWYWGNW